MTPTPAAQLAERAAECLAFERMAAFTGAAARAATRDTLREAAEELGFKPTEIEAAIDAALGAR